MTVLHRRDVMTRGLAAGCVAAGLAAFAGGASQARGRGPGVFAQGGFALAGTDPVAYLTEGRAVPGRLPMALEWRGAVWLFSTPENLMAFEMNPRELSPAYGGYCAMSMAQGFVAGSVPSAFTVVNGKVYLCSSQARLEQWRARTAENRAASDAAWEKLHS